MSGDSEQDGNAELLTIDEAVERGITKLRDPIWANPDAYIEITIVPIQGKNCHGPWVKLYDEPYQQAMREPTPQSILWPLWFRNEFATAKGWQPV